MKVDYFKDKLITKYVYDEIPIEISQKNVTSNEKPCEQYIDISIMNNQQLLSCIIFRNFYTYSISIKQLIQENNIQKEVSILSNYKLMKNPHFEGDAQDWHVIKADKFSPKFDSKSVARIRIYLIQPSPNW